MVLFSLQFLFIFLFWWLTRVVHTGRWSDFLVGESELGAACSPTEFWSGPSRRICADVYTSFAVQCASCVCVCVVTANSHECPCDEGRGALPVALLLLRARSNAGWPTPREPGAEHQENDQTFGSTFSLFASRCTPSAPRRSPRMRSSWTLLSGGRRSFPYGALHQGALSSRRPHQPAQQQGYLVPHTSRHLLGCCHSLHIRTVRQSS